VNIDAPRGRTEILWDCRERDEFWHQDTCAKAAQSRKKLTSSNDAHLIPVGYQTYFNANCMIRGG
jgi:hypothetical protein